MKKCIGPQYYKDFKCIADRCVHNCCKGGWLIELTEEMVQKYNSIPGPFGEQLRQSVTVDEEGSYVFQLVDGVCPHLGTTGLCNVFGELGESCMGTVCREFPRFSLHYGKVVETGIGLACEEAARIIMSQQKPFSIENIEVAQSGLVLEDNFETIEADDVYIDFLIRARTCMFQIIWEPGKTIYEKLNVLLELSMELQRHINCGSYNEVADCMPKVNRIVKMEEDAELAKETKKLLINIYRNLEQLNTDWENRADDIERCFIEESCIDVLEDIEGGENMELSLLSYFLYRYFMKSVDDYNVSDKIRLSICNYMMLMAQFAVLKEQEKFCFENLVEEARIFSRQVEYSDYNIESLLEEFNFGDELSESRIKLLFFK